MCYGVAMFKKVFSLMAVAAVVAPAFAVTWLDNAEAAKKQAKAENKLILTDFTGSDWCGWCIRMRKNVLDTPEFEAYAKDKFVFLEVDMPRRKAQSPELKKQNAELCKRYQVSGFPTMLVLNHKGDVVGGFGGYRDMAGMTAALDAAMKDAAALKAAAKLPEAEREAARDAIYSGMDAAARKATGDNARIEAKVTAQRNEFKEKINACATMEERLRVADECLKTAMPDNRLILLDCKFTTMVSLAETREDLEAARKVGDELIEALPSSYAAHIRSQIERDFADPDALLQRMKEAREAESK